MILKIVQKSGSKTAALQYDEDVKDESVGIPDPGCQTGSRLAGSLALFVSCWDWTSKPGRWIVVTTIYLCSQDESGAILQHLRSMHELEAAVGQAEATHSQH